MLSSRHVEGLLCTKLNPVSPFNFVIDFTLLLFYWIFLLVMFFYFQPVGEVGETKSMYKEVVLGGDVWDLLDELMIYMGNPMQFYERDVQFVRVKHLIFSKPVILLSAINVLSDMK